MVANRIDTISERGAELAELSIRMKATAKYFFMLLTEFDLPLPFFERFCTDPLLLISLVEKSKNLQVKDYFLNRFGGESKSTMLALRQRIDSVLISEGVRLSLSANSAPDFATLQDQGSLILINTAGRNITRGVSELLQALIVADIRQSVFRRSNQHQRFIWFFDEAQKLYKSSANRESMGDLLAMARSFGTFICLLTQSLTSAVRDADILNSILVNTRWTILLRSTLRDAELIAPGISLTGTVMKPRRNPFESPQYMSESEELKATIKGITKFPDRTAYCWLKAYIGTAMKITTPHVPPPHEIAGCSERELDQFIKSESIGQGVSKTEIIKNIEQQERRLRELLRPHTDRSTSSRGEAKEKKKGKQTLAKLLEEEYLKKTGRD